ncbi:hypothetical protein ILUMI_01620 [Ignelater luminosus]|uniref:Endonuclease n=1 Tax=Ignelater luminosus TaxID=2038154 RepID=A0A8K0DF00_IGNLU|nr:hypothetical protein ILUMI_01620 [Ignelater luminosus]
MFRSKEKSYGSWSLTELKLNRVTKFKRDNRKSKEHNRQYNENSAKNSREKYTRCKRCGAKRNHDATFRCTKQKKLCEVETKDESTDSDEDYNFLRVIRINKIEKQELWQVKLSVNGHKVIYKIDTGAEESVLSYKDYKQKFYLHYKLQDTNARLLGPRNGKKRDLKVYGKVKLPIEWSGDRYVINCFVLDTSENLLGRPALEKLKLVHWVNHKSVTVEGKCSTISDHDTKKNTVDANERNRKRTKPNGKGRRDSENIKTDRVVAQNKNVTGRSVEEHNGLLHKVLKILSKNGLTLNKDKCEFRRSETPYLGFIISANDIRADAKSVETIKQYPVPTDVTTVRRFLVIQDYYSKYPEIKKLQKTTSQAIVEYCKNVMSHRGIPTELRSENGKQFDSQEFIRFVKNMGSSEPAAARNTSNQMVKAESAVKLVKRILHMNEDPYIALLACRNTPLKCGVSPAQLLFGRTLRERVPVTKNKLSSKLSNHKEIREKIVQEQQRQKNHYDQRHRVKDNTELGKGDRA